METNLRLGRCRDIRPLFQDAAVDQGISTLNARIWARQLAGRRGCFQSSQFKKVVDLGGATGHLAIAICHAIPA